MKRTNGGTLGAHNLDVLAQRREHGVGEKEKRMEPQPRARTLAHFPLALDLTVRCVQQKTLQRTPVAPLKTNLAATEFGLKIGEQRCGTAMVPEGSGFRLGICQSRYFSLFRLTAPMFLGS